MNNLDPSSHSAESFILADSDRSGKVNRNQIAGIILDKTLLSITCYLKYFNCLNSCRRCRTETQTSTIQRKSTVEASLTKC